MPQSQDSPTCTIEGKWGRSGFSDAVARAGRGTGKPTPTPFSPWPKGRKEGRHEDHGARDGAARRVPERALGAGAHRRGARRARGDVLRRAGGRGVPPRVGGDDGARARPPRHRADRPRSHALRRLRGHRGRGARPVGGGHRALGPLREGDRTAGLPVAGRALAGADPHLQHLRGLPLRPQPPRLGDGRLGARGGGGRSLRGPRRLPPPGRRARAEPPRAGHHGDEDLALRSRGGRVGRVLHLRPRPRPGARAVPENPRRSGGPDGHHGGAALALAAPRRGPDRGRPRALRPLLVRGPDPHGQPHGPRRTTPRRPASRSA